MTQDHQETLNEMFLGKEDPDLAFKKPMTNNLKDEINQTLMCYEASVYSELGEHYPVTNQNKWDRKKAIQHILALINQKEREARIDELETIRVALEDPNEEDFEATIDFAIDAVEERIKQLKEELNKEVL